MPMQPGEVPATYANVDNLINAVGFKPNTPIEEGLQDLLIGLRSIIKSNSFSPFAKNRLLQYLNY